MYLALSLRMSFSSSRKLRSGQELLAPRRKRLKCRECLCRFNLGRNCDSKRLHSSKKTSSVVPFTLTVVGYIFFDCLVDAERSSVIESESKGTGAE